MHLHYWYQKNKDPFSKSKQLTPVLLEAEKYLAS